MPKSKLTCILCLASDASNQSFVCCLIKYTLALAGARSLTSSGNLSISFIQKNAVLHRYLTILKLYKLALNDSSY